MIAASFWDTPLGTPTCLIRCGQPQAGAASFGRHVLPPQRGTRAERSHVRQDLVDVELHALPRLVDGHAADQWVEGERHALADLLSAGHLSAVDAHAVQPYYTRLLAQSCGLSVRLAPEGDAVVVTAS